MKNYTLGCSLLMAILIIPCQAQINTSWDRIGKSQKFTFHSNFWVNLHHFLYQQAKNKYVAKQYAVPERAILANLKEKDKAAYEQAIAYYKKSILNRSYFNRQSIDTKSLLIQNKSTKKLRKKGLDQSLSKVLNKFAPVYKKHFWPLHHQANSKTIQTYLPKIQKFESDAFHLISTWGQNSWPQQKIRVDISKFANWAGAYTTNKPTIVTISSVDKRHQGSLFLEILFHEASHSIISGRRYAVATAIKEAAQVLDTKAPRGLWHYILFYFAGKATQKQLKAEGNSHRLYMQGRRLVLPQNFALMEKSFAPYFAGKATLQEAITPIMKDWKHKKKQKK